MVAPFGLELVRDRVDQLLRFGPLDLELLQEGFQDLDVRLLTR
jgi:hypothetical protein